MSQETYGSQPPPVDAKLTCQQITAFIIDYISQALPEATHALFEAHLRNCKDCVAFLNTYRESIRVTRSLHVEAIPPEMLNRVQAFLKTKIANDQSAG